MSTTAARSTPAVVRVGARARTPEDLGRVDETHWSTP